MNETSRRDVLVWAALLLVITASSAVALTVSGGNYRDISVAVIVIAYSPAVAALIVAALRGGAGDLVRSLIRWRAGVQWYLIAILGPFALTLLATSLVIGTGTATAAPAALVAFPFTAALIGPLIAGSLGEELGWRGFAQHRLQRSISPLVAALIVGALWALWHLWPLLTPLGRAESSVIDIAQTAVRLVATAVIYAWLYNRSGRSLPVVMVAHAGHNLAIETMPPEVLAAPAGGIALAALYLAAAVVVVVVDRKAWRTRV